MLVLDEATFDTGINIGKGLLYPIYLTILIIGSSYATWLKIKKNRQEKNHYLQTLKNREPLKQVFEKLYSIKVIWPISLVYLAGGGLLGLQFVLIINKIILISMSYLYETEFFLKSLLFLYVDLNITNAALVIASYSNLSLIPFAIISLLWCHRTINSKPKFDDEFALTIKDQALFQSYIFLCGIILIANIFIYSYSWAIIKIYLVKTENFEFNINSLMLLYDSLENVLPNLLVLYIFGLIISVFSILMLLASSYNFMEYAKTSIINNYSKDFPYLSIKTPSKELKGQLKDIFHKNLVVLNDNGVEKITSWTKIECLEIDDEGEKNDYGMNYIQ